jgi:cytochrome c5
LRRKKVADQEIKMDAGNKFLMVVSVLVLVAVVAFLVYHLAGFLGQLALGERDPAPEVIETVNQRIAPVGRVEVAAVDPDAAPAEPKPASEVYSSVCSACHNAGVAGAPKADDGDEWARRLEEKGLDTLVSHSINGFQGMPARGGNPNLSDEEVAGTVAYILEQAGVRVEDDAAVEEAVAEAPAVGRAEPAGVGGRNQRGRAMPRPARAGSLPARAATAPRVRAWASSRRLRGSLLTTSPDVCSSTAPGSRSVQPLP